MEDNIKRMYILEDMQEIESVLKNNVTDIQILRRLHRKIDSKYQACIKDWSNSLYCWIPNYGFNYELLDTDSLLENLESMLYKLSSYSMGFNNISSNI